MLNRLDFQVMGARAGEFLHISTYFLEILASRKTCKEIKIFMRAWITKWQSRSVCLAH